VGTHVIESGDTVASLAAAHGFTDPRIVWNAPENAELRQRRKPDILAPGDELYIPPRELRTVTVATGRRHTLRIERCLVRLRVALRDIVGKPRAGTTAVLEVDGKREDLTADGDGVIEMTIAPDARDAVLTVDGQEYDLEIGKLDPIDSEEGVTRRLRNLGYLVDGMGDDAEALSFAVELFQVDHELAVDGNDLESIREKLEEVHGC
jgi:hypothetical protein